MKVLRFFYRLDELPQSQEVLGGMLLFTAATLASLAVVGCLTG